MISVPSNTPKYLYPFSSNSFITSPFGKLIPSQCTLTPFSILTTAHLSTPNSIPISLENTLTNSTNASSSFTDFPYNLMSSIKTKWFMDLPPEPNKYPNFFSFLSNILNGNIITINRRGDKESP